MRVVTVIPTYGDAESAIEIAEELHEYMNKKFGKPRPKGWYGVQFFEPDEEFAVLEEL